MRAVRPGSKAAGDGTSQSQLATKREKKNGKGSKAKNQIVQERGGTRAAEGKDAHAVVERARRAALVPGHSDAVAQPREHAPRRPDAPPLAQPRPHAPHACAPHVQSSLVPQARQRTRAQPGAACLGSSACYPWAKPDAPTAGYNSWYSCASPDAASCQPSYEQQASAQIPPMSKMKMAALCG